VIVSVATGAMSADERPPGAVLSKDAEEDLAHAGRSVANAVFALFEGGALREKDARPYGHPGWFVARVSYRSVLFRWLEPEELEEAGYSRDGRIALIARVTDIPLPRLLSFVLPASVAACALVVGTVLAPGDLDRGDYGGFFGTSAQVIATVLVALALEARAALVEVRFALLTIVYVAVGLTAAVAGLLPSLPDALYEWLVGFTIAGGAGALISTLLLAAWSLARHT
jgi:hypothetical protein